MNLIIDTCGPALLLALCDGPAVVDMSHEAMAVGQSEAIVPALAALMKRATLAPDFAFDKIGVCVGPGSFTGLRVGLAVARARAAVLGTPIVPLNRLACIAWASGVKGPLRVEVDARRGEHFVQRFAQGSDPQGPPSLFSNAQLAQLGAQYPKDTVISQIPSGANMAAACAWLTHNAPVAPHRLISPLYVRAPDAKAQPAQLRTLAV